MKAAVYYKYGIPKDVVNVTEAEMPIPKEGEVLIKIHAASVNAYDWHNIRAKPFLVRLMGGGLTKPQSNIPGADIAGIIEKIGAAVTQWKPGDAVYGCLESCGKGGLAAGGFAEYVCAKETLLAPKPSGMTFKEASALPMAAVTALQGLRDNGQIKPSQKVLINGASGGVGTFAVQIAKAFGAEVTAVCSSKALDMALSLGADKVIDYTTEDFTKNANQYDVILDVAGNRSVRDYRRSLKQNGICAVVGFSSFRHLISIGVSRRKDGKKIGLVMAKNTSQSDLIILNELIEKRKLKSVIDTCYPLDEVSEALNYVENGHPKGKVIINICS